MKTVFRYRLIFLCFAILQSMAADAQTGINGRASRDVSKAFLMKLTDPARSEFRVGIVNVSATTGMRLSPKGQQPVVEYFSRHNNFVWAHASEQLRDSDEDDFRFRVERTRISSRQCRDLGQAVQTFYSELEKTISSDIDLARTPERPGLRAMTMDGTTFPIQIWTGTNKIVITPERDVNRSLQQAAYSLNSIVSRCSNWVEGRIENHRY